MVSYRLDLDLCADLMCDESPWVYVNLGGFGCSLSFDVRFSVVALWCF